MCLCLCLRSPAVRRGRHCYSVPTHPCAGGCYTTRCCSASRLRLPLVNDTRRVHSPRRRFVNLASNRDKAAALAATALNAALKAAILAAAATLAAATLATAAALAADGTRPRLIST